MSKDLRQFLKSVKEAGPDFYVEVKRTLKPELEVSVIQQKLAHEGRFPVIYYPEIEGSKLSLVSNLFGSHELLGLALDMSPKSIDRAEVVREYKEREVDLKPPQGVPTSDAPVKEAVLKGKDVDLGLLPVTKHHELDSGKYIAIGNLICRDPDTGILNCGVYRHEVKGKDQLGCMLVGTHDAAYITRRYAELGKPMEVVIFIGHHPAVIIGSTTRGSIDLNELELMGGLLQEPLLVTPAETVNLPVPAYAEIALEGIIDPSNMVTDGPFGEYPGYYGGVKPCYLIQLTALTMRKDAIYHDACPGQREHTMPGVLSSDSNAYDAVRKVVPTVKAVHFPPSGTNVYHVYVSIKKRLQGEGKWAGLAAIAAKPEVKLAVVVDEDIDVYNEAEVLWAVATRVVADKDVSIIAEATGAYLDPTAYDETRLKRGIMTSKMIIDATKPVDLPFAQRLAPPKSLWESMNLKDYLK